MDMTSCQSGTRWALSSGSLTIRPFGTRLLLNQMLCLFSCWSRPGIASQRKYSKGAELLVSRVSNSVTVTGDRLEDLVGGLGPDEGARVFVPVRQPVADVGAQLAHRTVDAAARLARGQLGEPALDEVQPRGAGGGEVQREARMGEQPAPHRRGLVGGVVVEDEVDLKVGRDLTLERCQEALELDRAMAGVRRADHLAGGGVERREQAAGAVALIVVGSARRRAGQQRLAAIERLDLALLVDAERDGALRRVEVQADDVAHLLDEQRILGELRVRDAVGLQAEGPPDARDRRLREAAGGRHPARRPVRAAVRRRRLQGAHDHLLDALVAERPRPARSRLIEQPLQTPGREPPAPLGHRRASDPQAARDLAVVLTGRAGQHDARTRRQAGRRAASARPALELLALPCGEHDLYRPWTT